MNRLGVCFANLVWLLGALHGCFLFALSTCWPRRAQLRILRRILAANRETEFGRSHGFRDVRDDGGYRRAAPPCEYEDIREHVLRIRGGAGNVLTAEDVRVLQPTSGSTGGGKWIPYTAALQREFRAAIAPWIAGLYLRHPTLLLGRQYWSISPNTRPEDREATSRVVRLGFADDTEYLGAAARALSRLLFAAPPELARIESPRAFEYATLLFLLRERNLRLISVWHPSYLTSLLEALPGHFPSLLEDIRRGGLRADMQVPSAVRTVWARRLRPDPARAEELAQIDPVGPAAWGRIWPRVRVISCWADGTAAAGAARLRAAFPGVHVQPKGLAATEGIVSLPVGPRDETVCAVASHFVEFEDLERPGDLRGAWELQVGRRYAVLVTTGGGLYRYRLGDIVRVTGFHRRAPCLVFEGRMGGLCDLVGEKLHATHVEDALAAAARRFGVRFAFAMAAPRTSGEATGYALYARYEEGDEPETAALAAFLDECLCEANFHYRHARRLGQLAPLRVRAAAPDSERRYRDRFVAAGMKPGDVKFDRLRREDDWASVLAQHDVEADAHR